MCLRQRLLQRWWRRTTPAARMPRRRRRQQHESVQQRHHHHSSSTLWCSILHASKQACTRPTGRARSSEKRRRQTPSPSRSISRPVIRPAPMHAAMAFVRALPRGFARCCVRVWASSLRGSFRSLSAAACRSSLSKQLACLVPSYVRRTWYDQYALTPLFLMNCSAVGSLQRLCACPCLWGLCA